MKSKKNGSNIGATRKCIRLTLTTISRNFMFWTCSPTPQVRDCMWVTRWATSPPISMPDINASKALTCCIRWATTPTVYPLNNTPSKPAPTQPSPPKRTSTATASRWTRSGSATIGTAKCVPATRSTTSGRSGPSCSFSTPTTATAAKRHSPSAS